MNVEFLLQITNDLVSATKKENSGQRVLGIRIIIRMIKHKRIRKMVTEELSWVE